MISKYFFNKQSILNTLLIKKKTGSKVLKGPTLGMSKRLDNSFFVLFLQGIIQEYFVRNDVFLLYTSLVVKLK